MMCQSLWLAYTYILAAICTCTCIVDVHVTLEECICVTLLSVILARLGTNYNVFTIDAYCRAPQHVHSSLSVSMLHLGVPKVWPERAADLHPGVVSGLSCVLIMYMYKCIG